MPPEPWKSENAAVWLTYTPPVRLRESCADSSRQTSSTHGEDGYITSDPGTIAALVERLYRKVEARVADFSFHESHHVQGSRTLLLTYGVTGRAARTACKELTSEGKPLSYLVPKTLWPVPEELLRSQARDYPRIVVVEANLGQYVREVERVLKDKTIDFLGAMNGRLITPARIKEAVCE